MKRTVPVLAALVAVFALACGGAESVEIRDDDQPRATATAAPDEASGADDPAGGLDVVTGSDGPGRARSVAGFLSPLVNLGLGGTTRGPSAVPGAQQGGGDLEQYLLSARDIPAGYHSAGTFSMDVPADPAIDFPGGELAASMWTTSELREGELPAGGSMLMVAVLRPDDPAALNEVLDQLDSFASDDDAISEALGGDGSFLANTIKDFEKLDSSGLGDNAGGIGVTIDMSAVFEGIAELGEELGEGLPPEVIDTFSAIKMRMRFLGEGDKLGMVIQIGFGDDAELADDLALAQKLRANLH